MSNLSTKTASFKEAYKRTAVYEGGYTAHPDDNGNWTGGRKGSGSLIGTNYGISAPVLAKYLNRKPTVTDMKNIDHSTVEAIYKANYWDKVRGDEIRHQEHANHLYDSAVNAGPSAAIKMAQRALALAETGIMNNQTLKAINA